MKSKSTSNHLTSQSFNTIAWITLIVYFITSFSGWFNILLSHIFHRCYFPLRSYLLTFNTRQITTVAKGIYNLSGFHAQVSTSVPYKIIDDLFFLLICTLLIILFLYGYKIVQAGKVNQIEIVKWSIIFSVLMAVSIPSHSTDLFGYVARGAQQSLYSQNPYINTVSEIKDYNLNPLFFNFMWQYQPTTYGPVFIYVTKAIVFLSNNNFPLSLVNFKLFNLTLFFLLILLVLRLNNAKDLYLIAWNPFILIQGLWNCHNDLFSVVLIFLGLYLLSKEKYFWSIFSLTFAGGIKFISFLIISIIFFYFLKTKPDKHIFLNLILGFCSGLILITIFSVDYLIPMGSVSFDAIRESISKIAVNIDLVHKSLIDTLITLLKYFCRWQHIACNLPLIQSYMKYGFYFMFGFLYLWVLLKRKVNLISDIVLVLFIFLLFTVSKFHSWYLLNLIVLLPLIEEGILKKLLITLSLSHTYAITFLDQARILNFVSMTLLPVLWIVFRVRKKK